MIYKKILAFFIVLAVLPSLALAYPLLPSSTNITNPEMVKTMRASITQMGGVDVTGSVSDLTLNVSIPLDDEFQKVESLSVNYDYDIVTDKYGNRFVRMHWDKPPQKIEYVISAVVSTSRRIDGAQRYESEFLKPTENTESDDPGIMFLASQFKGNDFEKISALTAWVHHNIDYDMKYYDVTSTSVQTLASREGVCDEISNLLIASAKSLGYHSAAAMGWVIGETKSEPHSWVEIYTQNETIEVDPTWAEGGFVDASHIKYATVPDAVFMMIGARVTGSSDNVKFLNNSFDIELLDVEQEPIIQSESVLLDKTLWENQYAVVKTDLSYDGCILTTVKSQSCALEDKDFLTSLTPDQTIYFCGQRSVFSVFKVPEGLSDEVVYSCPVTVFPAVGESVDLDVGISGGQKAGDSALSVNETVLKPGEAFSAVSDGSHIFTNYGAYGFERLESSAPYYSFKIYSYNSGALLQQDMAVLSDGEFDISVDAPASINPGEEVNMTVSVENLGVSSRDVVVDLDGYTQTAAIGGGESHAFIFTVMPENFSGDMIPITVRSGTFSVGVSRTVSVVQPSNFIQDIIDAILGFINSLVGG